jgi:hypothetical protein
LFIIAGEIMIPSESSRSDALEGSICEEIQAAVVGTNQGDDIDNPD